MPVLGFEPRTSALSELRSSQLSYTRVQRKKPNLLRFGSIRERAGIERSSLRNGTKNQNSHNASCSRKMREITDDGIIGGPGNLSTGNQPDFRPLSGPPGVSMFMAAPGFVSGTCLQGPIKPA